MDLKRYEKVSPVEAVKMILNGEEVFNTEDGEKMLKYYLKNDLIVYDRDKQKAIGSLVTVNRLLMSSDWYVKKPFDVRAEMLARPDEWVGAFRNASGTWVKIGFDFKEMTPVITVLSNTRTKPDHSDINCTIPSKSILEKFIPIEDVPKEDLL